MRISFGNDLKSRDGTLTRDAKCKNYIIDVDGDGNPVRVSKRPGLTSFGLVRAGTAQLLTYWNGIKAITGDYFSSVTTTITNYAASIWKGSDSDPGITLSNGNLTASSISPNTGIARSTVSVSSGTWVFEVTFVSGGAVYIGMANASAILTNDPASDNGSVLYNETGIIVKNGLTVTTAATYIVGDVIGVLYNASANSIQWYKNGIFVYEATGGNVPTGALYACIGFQAGTGTLTANFGATAFAYTYTGVVSTNLSPTTANLPFTAQDNGSNAGTDYLMFKNATQGWTLTPSGVPTLITDVDYPGTYAVTATSLTRSGTVATVTTAFDTNFQAGSNVVISGATPSTYNGTQTITTVTASSVTTVGPVVITIARSGTTATATSANPHGFTNGTSITISGATQTEYNGAKTITWLSTTTFSFTVTVTGTPLPATPATGSPVLTQYAEFNGSNTSGAPTVFTCYQLQYGDAFVNGETAIVLNGSAGMIGATATISAVSGNSFTATIPGATFISTVPLTIAIRRTALTISSIARVGTVATVTTSTAHKFLTGKGVTITAATEYQYNGFFYISVISATTFSYVLVNTESPATPATGTISAIYTLTVGASFTFTILGSPATPATGSIVVTGGRNTVPGIAYLNGRFGVMDINGVLYTSDDENPTAWRALDYTTAQNETGAGVYLGKSQSYVVAFKEWSTEFFYDAANPVGSPWSPVESGFTQNGCASGGSVAVLGEAHFWISQSKNIKGRTVHMMVGTQQTKISTTDVERVLNASTLTTVHSYCVKLDGSSLYVLTLATSNITLVFDIDSRIWSQWSSLTIAASKSVTSITLSGTTATVTTSTAHGLSDGDPVNISGATQTGYNGIWQITYVSATVFTITVAAGLVTPATGTILAYPYTESYLKFTKYTVSGDDDLLLHESDGYLYEVLSSVYRDAGIPIVNHTRSTRIDGDTTDPKSMSTLTLIADKVADTMMVRWSDDDCTTFTTYRGVNMDYPRPMVRQVKKFRRRTIETNYIGNNPMICTALEPGAGK